MKYLKKFENSLSDSKFKEGDYVICIRGYDSNLRIGNLYKISKVIFSSGQGIFYSLKEDLLESEWMEERFRLATEEEVSMKKYNL